MHLAARGVRTGVGGDGVVPGETSFVTGSSGFSWRWILFSSGLQATHFEGLKKADAPLLSLKKLPSPSFKKKG
jgi:hypothetical protein